MKHITNINYDVRSYKIYVAYSYEDKIDLNGYELYPLVSLRDDLRFKAEGMISRCLTTLNSYLYILMTDEDLLPDVDIPMWVSLKGFHISDEISELSGILIEDFLNSFNLR